MNAFFGNLMALGARVKSGIHDTLSLKDGRPAQVVSTTLAVYQTSTERALAPIEPIWAPRTFRGTVGKRTPEVYPIRLRTRERVGFTGLDDKHDGLLASSRRGESQLHTADSMRGRTKQLLPRLG